MRLFTKTDLFFKVTVRARRPQIHKLRPNFSPNTFCLACTCCDLGALFLLLLFLFYFTVNVNLAHYNPAYFSHEYYVSGPCEHLSLPPWGGKLKIVTATTPRSPEEASGVKGYRGI